LTRPGFNCQAPRGGARFSDTTHGGVRTAWVDGLFRQPSQIELIDQVIQVVVRPGHVLDQQFPRHRCGPRPATVMPNTSDPTAAHTSVRPRGMQDARRHQPPRCPLQPIRLRKIENAVVAFVPALQAAADVLWFVVPGSRPENVWAENCCPLAFNWGGKIIRLGVYTCCPTSASLRIALSACGGGMGPGCRRTCYKTASRSDSAPQIDRPNQVAPPPGDGFPARWNASAVGNHVAKALIHGAPYWRQPWSRRTSVRRCRPFRPQGVQVGANAI